MRLGNITIGAALGFGGLVGMLVAFGWLTERGAAVGSMPRPVWTEVQWPFPMDQWGQGKAFRCRAAECGTEVSIYVRAKIGFCNCTAGVTDDEELERLSDFSFIRGDLVASSEGRAIAVARMKGRSRSYAVSSPQAGRSAISIAFNDRCDAIVTTVVLGHDRPAEIEPHVIALLNGRTVLDWAEVTLGL